MLKIFEIHSMLDIFKPYLFKRKILEYLIKNYIKKTINYFQFYLSKL